MSESTNFNGVKPPWIVFPDILANDLAAYLKQGVTEAWFDQVWRPFWTALDTTQKVMYLRHWSAPQEWIEAINNAFDLPDDFDAEADARDSDAHLSSLREAQSAVAKRPWLRRMFS